MECENGRASWLRGKCPHRPRESGKPRKGVQEAWGKGSALQAAGWRMRYSQNKRNGIAMQAVSILRLSNENVAAF